MLKHHSDTLKNVVKRLETDPNVLAVILGGSIAHGFAKENSDVDIMIVVTPEDYEKRTLENNLHYFEMESVTYEGGYVDGKYISLAFMKKVAEKGSDPARFAFKDAVIAFSREPEVEKVVNQIAVYPVQEKSQRIKRFFAQVQAWNWYCGEAFKHNNPYLINHSISNLVLFGGRMILAYNEELYPYHKWYLKVLENCRHKPVDLMINLYNLLENKTPDHVAAFFNCIMNFTDWQVGEINWPQIFMEDSELNWLDGKTPIADL